MAAVRTEQEQRCSLNKLYTNDFAKLENALPASETQNYTYNLSGASISATSKGSLNYTLKMPSFADGRICCDTEAEGNQCANLNKDYPACNELIARADYTQAEAECTPPVPCEGDDTQPCGCNNSGTQTRTCQADGTWGDWGECTGTHCECPGEPEKQLESAYTPDGKTPTGCAYRYQVQICDHEEGQWTYANSTSYWTDESRCCTSSQRPSCNCGDGTGTRYGTCQSDGTWSAADCSGCAAQPCTGNDWRYKSCSAGYTSGQSNGKSTDKEYATGCVNGSYQFPGGTSTAGCCSNSSRKKEVDCTSNDRPAGYTGGKKTCYYITCKTNGTWDTSSWDSCGSCSGYTPINPQGNDNNDSSDDCSYPKCKYGNICYANGATIYGAGSNCYKCNTTTVNQWRSTLDDIGNIRDDIGNITANPMPQYQFSFYYTEVTGGSTHWGDPIVDPPAVAVGCSTSYSSNCPVSVGNSGAKCENGVVRPRGCSAVSNCL